MDKKQLVDKLFAAKQMDESLTAQLAAFKAAIAAALAEAATLSDPDKDFVDEPVTVEYADRFKLPRLPYENLVVKLDGEIAPQGDYFPQPDGYVIFGYDISAKQVAVSYFHDGIQDEIDEVLVFFPDLLSSEFYFERVAFWQQVAMALEGF